MARRGVTPSDCLVRLLADDEGGASHGKEQFGRRRCFSRMQERHGIRSPVGGCLLLVRCLNEPQLSGYAFRPREARSRDGVTFTSFLPAMSPEALKAKSDRLREMRIPKRTDLTLDDLARWLNPILVGWINYYGRYYRTGIDPLLQRVSSYLRRWAAKKYRRLRSATRFDRWWTGLLIRQPGLFAHWRLVRNY